KIRRRYCVADRKHDGLGFCFSYIFDGFIKKQVRITSEVFRLHHDMLHGMPVGSSKTPSKGIKGEPKLTSSSCGFELKCLRVESAIGSSKRHGRAIWMIGRTYFAAI